MSNSTTQRVKFDNSVNSEFLKALRARTNEYFKTNKISRYSNGSMVFKTIFMVALYLTPFFLVVFNVFSSPWMVLLMYVVMGVGMAGIGLSIMHDANHGAYSKNQKWNIRLGYLLNLVGGSALNWKIQHNILHHTYTNVEGLDEDIDPGSAMRFSPHAPHKKAHRFQHIYAWFLYGLMTFAWIMWKDIVQLFRYQKLGLTKTTGKTFKQAIWDVVGTKVFYFTYMLVIPIIFVEQPFWLLLIYFFCMHFVAGLILGCVFQPAHVMPTSEYPLPDDEGIIKNNWAVHQLHTTANFAPGNKILSWYVGGLNYQIEHHLFPNICHIHYKNLAPIVKKTAEEYGIPYNSQKTFVGALWKHGKMLKQLGRAA